MIKHKKLRLGLIFGGMSSEHEVSIESAKNIFHALNSSKYEVVLIKIEKTGKWFVGKPDYFFTKNGQQRKKNAKPEQVAILPNYSRQLIYLNNRRRPIRLDVVFPIVHGSFGEDGSLQGVLKMSGIPFVGSGVLGSALSMDKEVSKRLFLQAGIKVAKFLSFKRGERVNFGQIQKTLGFPVFVKPANQGSSVGVSKAHNLKELAVAVQLAFQFDEKILVEASISGVEVECSVLGNGKPKAALPGVLVPRHEFYSYEAKYVDRQGADFQIPAKMSKLKMREVQQLAIHVFGLLELAGLARVDFFLKPKGELYLNEVNTLPGFTSISMYPKLWEVSGVPYSNLIDELVALAMQRHEASLASGSQL